MLSSLIELLKRMLNISSLAKRFFGSANERFIKGCRNPSSRSTAWSRRSQAVRRRAAGADRLAEGAARQGRNPRRRAAGRLCHRREAAKRTLGQRHFDVQLAGGMVLHRGMISEMKTGEGKTLVATLAVYLNALEGNGVHVVTVNDYLARRDSEWMGQIYTFPA